MEEFENRQFLIAVGAWDHLILANVNSKLINPFAVQLWAYNFTVVAKYVSTSTWILLIWG